MKSLSACLLLFLIFPLASCVSTKLGPPSASVFVTLEDAPISSVVGFTTTISSIKLNGTGSSQTELLAPNAPSVDFARLIGLRAPLTLVSGIPIDTYSGVTITLASTPAPVIATVDGSGNVTLTNGTLAQATVTVPFPVPVTLAKDQLTGLRLELDIQKTLQFSNGQVTVNPAFFAKGIQNSDTDAQITELTGAISGVAAANKSFTMPGTIKVTQSTQFNGTNTVQTLQSGAIAAVEGKYDSDGSITATWVEVIAAGPSYETGIVVATSGQTVTMWVEESSSDLKSDVAKTKTYDLSQVAQYDTCFIGAVTSSAVFSGSTVLVGQRIMVTGTATNSVLTPVEVSLRRQGVYGTLVPGSVNITTAPNAGNFQMPGSGLAGFPASAPLVVTTGTNSTFFSISGGLPTLQSSITAVPLIARGLILKDPNSGNPAMWAGWVAAPNQ